MYALLLAIIYVAFISLGLPDSLVGAGWPVMHQDLHVPVAYAGLVTVIIASGTIVSSLASERLTRRFGAGRVTAISVAMTAAALLGFSTSSQFWMLLVWAVPYGLGAGAVDAALNNYVALHYAARHMNWLHSFWGVGASISPFIMSHALSSDLGWTGAYRVVGILQVVLSALLFLSLPLWTRAVRPATAGTGTEAGSAVEPGAEGPDGAAPAGGEAAGKGANGADGGPVGLARALRIPGVPFILTAFFTYCAVESTTMIWAATYLVSVRDVAPATAAAFSSLFILGITAGRFLAGFFADCVGDRALIRGGFTMMGLGVLLLAIPGLPQAVALGGLVIAGLGAAPVYPAIIHSTPANFGANNSQAIIGIQMASAYTGSTVMPPLFGALGSWIGMWILPFILIILAVLGLAQSERLNRLAMR